MKIDKKYGDDKNHHGISYEMTVLSCEFVDRIYDI